jgi:outer membrane protein TolC
MPTVPSGIDYAPGLSPSSAQQALTYVNETHPVIAQYRAQVFAAEAAVRNARAQFSPTVNVTYGKQTYQGTAQGDYLAQLVVSVPLFDGGTAYGATGAAQGNLQAIEFNLKESELIIRERIASFWADWVSAKNRKVLGISQAKTAQSLVDGYKMQFQVGRRSLLDLLNVQSDLFTYQTNAENAAYEARIARARIMAAIGKLAVSYSDPGGSVDKYDPPPTGSKNDYPVTQQPSANNQDWTGTTVGVLPARLAQQPLNGASKP